VSLSELFGVCGGGGRAVPVRSDAKPGPGQFCHRLRQNWLLQPSSAGGRRRNSRPLRIRQIHPMPHSQQACCLSHGRFRAGHGSLRQIIQKELRHLIRKVASIRSLVSLAFLDKLARRSQHGLAWEGVGLGLSFLSFEKNCPSDSDWTAVYFGLERHCSLKSYLRIGCQNEAAGTAIAAAVAGV